ncbi:MAG: DUF3566 domain-containing protein [Corynebacterium sp.]|nr:DUF3566 domain-containing protein [Corynebacterium sp.]
MARQEVALKRISAFSAFRVGLAFSIVGLAAWLITVTLLYFGMDQAGIWASLNGVIFDVGGNQSITFGLVFAIAALIGAVMALLTTILAPLVAMMYNAIADLFGGYEMTLQDRPTRRRK